MTYDDQNIFAKIIRGEMPCHKVYEDETSLAFLDIMPRSEGHTLVIPKKAKAINMRDILPDDLCTLIKAVHKIAPAVMSGMNADGFIIQQFNETAAGQVVFHIHFHIVPRYKDTPLRHAYSDMEDTAVLEANAEKIRAAVAALA